MEVNEAREICQQFANDLKLIFEDEGECGFGRECVGFNTGGQWLTHNPYDSVNYDQIEKFACDAAYAPDGVDSYHKHDCLAVIGRGDDAIIQLAMWVNSIRAAGTPSVEEFETGATGMQAMLSGVVGKTLMIN